jgi:hypothetical protein
MQHSTSTTAKKLITGYPQRGRLANNTPSPKGERHDPVSVAADGTQSTSGLDHRLTSKSHRRQQLKGA